MFIFKYTYKRKKERSLPDRRRQREARPPWAATRRGRSLRPSARGTLSRAWRCAAPDQARWRAWCSQRRTRRRWCTWSPARLAWPACAARGSLRRRAQCAAPPPPCTAPRQSRQFRPAVRRTFDWLFIGFECTVQTTKQATNKTTNLSVVKLFRRAHTKPKLVWRKQIAKNNAKQQTQIWRKRERKRRKKKKKETEERCELPVNIGRVERQFDFGEHEVVWFRAWRVCAKQHTLHRILFVGHTAPRALAFARQTALPKQQNKKITKKKKKKKRGKDRRFFVWQPLERERWPLKSVTEHQIVEKRCVLFPDFVFFRHRCFRQLSRFAWRHLRFAWRACRNAKPMAAWAHTHTHTYTNTNQYSIQTHKQKRENKQTQPKSHLQQHYTATQLMICPERGVCYMREQKICVYMLLSNSTRKQCLWLVVGGRDFQKSKGVKSPDASPTEQTRRQSENGFERRGSASRKHCQRTRGGNVPICLSLCACGTQRWRPPSGVVCACASLCVCVCVRVCVRATAFAKLERFLREICAETRRTHSAPPPSILLTDRYFISFFFFFFFADHWCACVYNARAANRTDPHTHTPAHTHAQDGELQYEVKWRGFPSSDNTWQPAELVRAHAKAALRAWLAQRGERGSKPKSKKKKKAARPPSFKAGHDVAAIVRVKKTEGKLLAVVRWRAGSADVSVSCCLDLISELLFVSFDFLLLI